MSENSELDGREVELEAALKETVGAQMGTLISCVPGRLGYFEAVLQGESDPAPGYYVSMTSLFDASITNERNPRRFVDAASIPYVVLPPEGFKHAKLGDFATVVNLQNGKVAAAIVADESAPELPMGEGSIALAKALASTLIPAVVGSSKGLATSFIPVLALASRGLWMRLSRHRRRTSKGGEAYGGSVAASMSEMAIFHHLSANTPDHSLADPNHQP
jgi:hypothetical protein